MSDSRNTVLSIIIPTLNEAENLPELLADLNQQKNIRLEVIIGDGGSTDATQSVAEAYAAKFVTAGRGRGAQMNAAALQATGAYFLFLHADSRIDDPSLLSNALNALTLAERHPSLIAGHFRLEFIRSTPCNAMAYRYAEEKTAFNRVNTTNVLQTAWLFQ